VASITIFTVLYPQSTQQLAHTFQQNHLVYVISATSIAAI